MWRRKPYVSLYIDGYEDAWAQDIATQRLNAAYRGRAEKILQQNSSLVLQHGKV